MKPEVLQLCPFMPTLEAALAERFTLHRWFEMVDGDRFLDSHGASIRGVVTGGHLGLPPEIGARLPGLEIVAINGVGYDKVDLPTAKARGYRVTNTPDVLTEDVADLAIGLSISLLRQIVRGHDHVRNGQWPSGDLSLGRKVSRRRFGILGLGRIGRAIAKRLEAFDCPIAYASRTKLDVPYAFHPSPLALASNCDALIVAASASPETRHIIDAEVLAALGPQGVLVNVARGALVDEAALVAALTTGQLGGAALDVFEDEPRVPRALWEMPNVVLTPHMASATHETRADMARLLLANLDAHFSGQPLPAAVV